MEKLLYFQYAFTPNWVLEIDLCLSEFHWNNSSKMLVLVVETSVAINIQFIQYNSIIFHVELREPFDSFYSVKTRKIKYMWGSRITWTRYWCMRVCIVNSWHGSIKLTVWIQHDLSDLPLLAASPTFRTNKKGDPASASKSLITSCIRGKKNNFEGKCH